MPSTTPLTDAINALTQYANDTTGASDTNLSDAVGTLVAGYGGGGGGGNPMFSAGNIQALIFHSAYFATDYTDTMQNVYTMMLKSGTAVNYEHFFSMAAGNKRVGSQRNTAQATSLNFYMQSSTKSNVYAPVDKVPYIATADCIGLSAVTVTLPLIIGGGYYNGNIENQKSNMTFYGMNIIDSNGDYVARFMPWLDGSTPCIKELISGTLYNPITGTVGYIDNSGTVHN